MKVIGLISYRFSISWSRVIPEEGKVSKKGLDFYSNLVDELLAAGIEPLVTIFHWDTPIWSIKKEDARKMSMRWIKAEYGKPENIDGMRD